MSAPVIHEPETDPRFPSGAWVGFYLQKAIPGRHNMELLLTFSKGNMTGEGRDRVGAFIVRGSYTLADGKCHWTKRYLKKHDVFYQGFNEGKGIWGVWIIPPEGADPEYRGGFHIWPEGMSDPTGSRLTAELELHTPVEQRVEVENPVEVPAGVEGNLESKLVQAPPSGHSFPGAM